MDIHIQQADIFEIEAEALVYPGATTGQFINGFGERILTAAGEAVAETTRATAPIAIGAATVVPLSGLNAESLIYSPLILEPGEKVIVENVRRCTRAALVAAAAKSLLSVAIPVIHPSSEEMTLLETARAMLDELRGFRTDIDIDVYLVDPDEAVIESLHRAQEVVR